MVRREYELASLPGYVAINHVLLMLSIHRQDGQTAVHLAARNGHLDILRKLVRLGIEIDDRDSVSRHTPIFLSVCFF